MESRAWGRERLSERGWQTFTPGPDGGELVRREDRRLVTLGVCSAPLQLRRRRGSRPREELQKSKARRSLAFIPEGRAPSAASGPGATIPVHWKLFREVGDDSRLVQANSAQQGKCHSWRLSPRILDARFRPSSQFLRVAEMASRGPLAPYATHAYPRPRQPLRATSRTSSTGRQVLLP